MMRRVMVGTAMAMLLTPGAIAQAPRGPAGYDFTYRYPTQAGRIAPLKTWLDADKARLRAKVAAGSAEFRRMMRNERQPLPRYAVSREWQLVADTPRFLSLSSSLYEFSGGAHGNTGSGGLLWDKRMGRRLDPKAVFASLPALQAAVAKPWCDGLNRERVRRLGSQSDGGNLFSKCPDVKELTVLLGSSNGKAFDRTGLIADQYVAGSYAEGPYEVTLPVTPAVLRAVKPEYRAAFAVR